MSGVRLGFPNPDPISERPKCVIFRYPFSDLASFFLVPFLQICWVFFVQSSSMCFLILENLKYHVLLSKLSHQRLIFGNELCACKIVFGSEILNLF